MHLIESFRRWLLAELRGAAAIAGRFPANSIAAMTNTDDTPVNPGVYVQVPSSTQPERWAGSVIATVHAICSTEAEALELLGLLDSKFARLDRDTSEAWAVPPRSRGLCLHRIRVTRSDGPVNLTVAGSTPLYACTLHLEAKASLTSS